MDAELDPRVRQLLDKQAITELLYERGRAIDRHDIDAQLLAFTDDATMTHLGWHGTVRDFLAHRSATAPGKKEVKVMAHFVANVIVQLDDERRARAHSYHLCTATMEGVAEGDPTDRIVVGRYFDWLVNTAEGWRIRHRDAVFDWSFTTPFGARTWEKDVGSPFMLVGTSDTFDPYFARFGSVEPPPPETA